MSVSDVLLDRGLVPDAIVRWAIRRRCAERLRSLKSGTTSDHERREREFREGLRSSDIAIHTDKANEQHYELPPRFLQLCLGPRMKYSSGYWPEGVESLTESELAMLELYLERGRFENGMKILELGCGWGSLTLHLAATFPESRILGVSNSAPQQEWILARAEERGLSNIEIRTSDVNTLKLEENCFDRVVSIEMFEHMKNYEVLLQRIAGWLRPEGLLFVHMFTHRRHSYHYEVSSAADWMARYFFTGGTMAAHDLLPGVSRDLELVEDWRLNGHHYERTANAWLATMDRHRDECRGILHGVYGEDAPKWWVRWRVFFMACAEMFGFENGEQWLVSHYLMRPRR